MLKLKYLDTTASSFSEVFRGATDITDFLDTWEAQTSYIPGKAIELHNTQFTFTYLNNPMGQTSYLEMHILYTDRIYRSYIAKETQLH